MEVRFKTALVDIYKDKYVYAWIFLGKRRYISSWNTTVIKMIILNDCARRKVYYSIDATRPGNSCHGGRGREEDRYCPASSGQVTGQHAKNLHWPNTLILHVDVTSWVSCDIEFYSAVTQPVFMRFIVPIVLFRQLFSCHMFLLFLFSIWELKTTTVLTQIFFSRTSHLFHLMNITRQLRTSLSHRQLSYVYFHCRRRSHQPATGTLYADPQLPTRITW